MTLMNPFEESGMGSAAAVGNCPEICEELQPQLLTSGVAVEKFPLQKSAEIRSRQDALQAICWGRLDIFYPRIRAGFLRF